MKRGKEVERLISEAPKFKFNTNIFKASQSQLELSEEERKTEEDLIEDLAKFLNDQAIPFLITELKQLEGVPTDSNTLKSFFHNRGVNMRYLGKVIDQFGKILYFDKQANKVVTKEDLKTDEQKQDLQVQ